MVKIFCSDTAWVLGLMENHTKFSTGNIFGACIGMQVCNQLSCYKALTPKATLCRKSKYHQSYFYVVIGLVYCFRVYSISFSMLWPSLKVQHLKVGCNKWC